MFDVQEIALADRLRITFELHEDGVALMRQNLRRAAPEATDEVIDERLVRWLRTRPGAEHGDCVGRLRPLPE